MSDSARSGRDWVYRLLHAESYWEALCSIKHIDQSAAGGERDEFVGDEPQSPIAVSLLDLVIDHHDKDFQEVWDDFETALASGAPSEIRSLHTGRFRGGDDGGQ